MGLMRMLGHAAKRVLSAVVRSGTWLDEGGGRWTYEDMRRDATLDRKNLEVVLGALPEDSTILFDDGDREAVGDLREAVRIFGLPGVMRPASLLAAFRAASKKAPTKRASRAKKQPLQKAPPRGGKK